MDVPVLVCTAGELVGLRVAVPEGGLGIGRSADNVVSCRTRACRGNTPGFFSTTARFGCRTPVLATGC